MARHTSLLCVIVLIITMFTARTTPTRTCRIGGVDYKYNNDKQICCGGHLKHRFLYTRCCEGARAVYDRSHEVCCGDVIMQLREGMNPGDIECCNNQFYDTRRKKCCMKKLYNTTSQIAEDLSVDIPGFCCGDDFIKISDDGPRKACCLSDAGYSLAGKPFDVPNQVCCQGYVRDIFGGKRQCCGTEVYDPYSHHCCRAEENTYQILPRIGYGPNACCKNAPGGLIDSASHMCVDGEVVERECHADDPFNPAIRCCNRHLRYNVTIHKCCGGKLLRATDTCCQRQQLPEGYLCCGSRHGAVLPTDPSHNACCPGTSSNYSTYNNELAECIHRRVVLTAWCGSVRYDPKKKMCCDGHLRQNYVGYQCCGRDIYNAKYMSCCKGKISAPSTTCNL